VLLFSLLLWGCGSGSSSSNTPAPTASGNPPPSSAGAGTPPPPPSSGASGGSGGSGNSGGSGSSGSSGGSGSGGSSSGSGNTGGSGTTGSSSQEPQHYSEAMLPIGAATAGVGEVNRNINNSPVIGQYALTLAGGSSADTYTARFCPFAAASCTTLTDPPMFRNSGGVQFVGTFPGHGASSGEFIISKNGADASATGFTVPNDRASLNGDAMQAQLVRASEISGGLGAQAQFGIGTDPLTSGSAVVSQPAATVKTTVGGASALTTYTVSYCDPAGAKCVELGTLTTDASGSGSASISVSPAQSPGNANSGQFKLSRNGANGPLEFVSGFIVP